MDRRTDAQTAGVATPADAGPEASGGGVQASVNGHFERDSRFWDELYSGGDVYGEIHRLRLETALRWIDELKLPASAQVLELGCGAGRAAVALAKRGFEVRATDTVPAMLERAAANAAAAGVGDRVTFGVADVQALEFGSDQFGVVLALGVIPWVASPGRALAEIARVTCAGGAVVLNADNAARLHYMLDPRLNPHLASTRVAVKTLLRRQGAAVSAQSRLHAIGEFDELLNAAGLERVRDTALGFGPFTMLGRRALPHRLGVLLHRSLQRRADQGAEGLAARGAQYLVLARKRLAKPAADAA